MLDSKTQITKIERLRELLSGASLIAQREIRDQLRDWRILVPIVLLTLFFPVLMNFTANSLVSFVEKYNAPLIGDRLIPFLLMIVGFFPISISLVIALESFVGEKERLTIEPLLCTPLSDSQIFIGKLWASLFLPLSASYLGILVYLVGIWTLLGWRAPVAFLLLIFVLTTMQGMVMVSGAVVISSQTTSVRAANLLASFVIIPMALLIQGESVIMFWAHYGALWWIALGLLVVAGLLMRVGLAQFRREELLGRELDNINLKRVLKTFWANFKGQAGNILDWYLKELTHSLKVTLLPTALSALVLLMGVIIGIKEANVFLFPLDSVPQSSTLSLITSRLELLKTIPIASFSLVWFQNLRAIFLATLAGIFTFGVLGVLILALPFALIGYFMASMARIGISPWIFLSAFILPHGLFELPAILVSGGAILRLGATLVAPSSGRTVSEAWLRALADWAKLALGLVLPLMLIAAGVEMFITPRIALWLLNR